MASIISFGAVRHLGKYCHTTNMTNRYFLLINEIGSSKFLRIFYPCTRVHTRIQSAAKSNENSYICLKEQNLNAYCEHSHRYGTHCDYVNWSFA